LYADQGKTLYVWKKNGQRVLKRESNAGCIHAAFFSMDEKKLFRLEADTIRVIWIANDSVNFFHAPFMNPDPCKDDRKITRSGDYFLINGPGQDAIFDLVNEKIFLIEKSFFFSQFKVPGNDTIYALVRSRNAIHFLAVDQFGSDLAQIPQIGIGSYLHSFRGDIVFSNMYPPRFTYIVLIYLINDILAITRCFILISPGPCFGRAAKWC
jgi:hypothetical protein